MRALISLTAAAALLAAGAAGAADSPAGIVMAMTGDSDPPLSIMAEIPAGIPLQLKADASLTFLHYGRCKLVTVVGGKLVLQAGDYNADGKVASESDAPCPRVVALSDAGSGGRTAGGFVARGIAMPPPRWPTAPQIAFTGPRAGAVSDATILGEDRQPVLRLDIAPGRGRLPSGAGALKADGHYTLRLALRDRPDPVDIPFATAASTAAGMLIVLRLD